MNSVVLVGRILYSLIFIMSGLMGHFGSLNETSQYAAMKGVPMPVIMTVITGIMIVVGGLSVMLGYKVKIGAALLVAFLIPTAFLMHNFWAIEDAMMAQIEMSQFMKNLSLTGGALIIMHFGSGPLSLEKDDESGKTEEA